jgi:hypothetical protein
MGSSFELAARLDELFRQLSVAEKLSKIEVQQCRLILF